MPTDRVLLRGVHKNWITKGIPSFMAFEPSSADEGALSVDTMPPSTPEATFNLLKAAKPHGFNAQSTKQVWAVSVPEVISLELPCCLDPQEADSVRNTPANPAHALIDFTACDQSEWPTKAESLWGFAEKRKRQYPTA